MRGYSKVWLLVFTGPMAGLVLLACSAPEENANTTATTTVTPPATQTLTVVPPPDKVVAMKEQRGELEQAQPMLRILSPANNAVLEGSTVEVRLALSGDLRGYKPGKDPKTDSGDHIHVILDNDPYEAYYDLNEPFVYREVAPGQHTIRVFASRPWHESYKNEGSFQMVTFTVKGRETASATPRPAQNVNSNTMESSPGQNVPDPKRPLLTYSRPKGEYKGEEADPIMIDFWLANAQLKEGGGEYRVRYIIDNDEPRYIDGWEPVWLAGWINGKHSVRLELLGPDGSPIKNGSFNTTTREITVIK